MTEFLAEYGLFLLKTATIVAGIVVIIGSAAAAGKKASHLETLEVEDLNKKYRALASALKKAILNKVIEAEQWEKFLGKKYVGTKRFGLDGGESMIPALESVIKYGGQMGVREIVFGGGAAKKRPAKKRPAKKRPTKKRAAKKKVAKRSAVEAAPRKRKTVAKKVAKKAPSRRRRP